MEGISALVWPLTAWHWLALGLILLSIEMAVGTFDLLWIAIAAGITAIFAAIAPAGLSDWQGQLIFFAVAAVGLFVLGRTVFAGMRQMVGDHPTLNRRMDRTIGQRGVTVGAFASGMGRVKLGDTEWSAETVDGSNPRDGTAIIVAETAGNVLRIKPA
ncbi:NfeD family protein [Henriciella aquimarina]|uniref:NfeD family protein n=1 Tax=Henriciella aquimarina TaxID=545261 RepID=UPI0009FC5C35|nr:NfeD family protein [Henriciella aquimarina]